MFNSSSIVALAGNEGQLLYRNDELGIQMEIYTPKKYGYVDETKKPKRYFFISPPEPVYPQGSGATLRITDLRLNCAGRKRKIIYEIKNKHTARAENQDADKRQI